MTTPLPFAAATSYAYAKARATGKSPAGSEWPAGRAWSNWNNQQRRDLGEAGDAEHEQVWGAGAPLTTLLVIPPDPRLVPPPAARVLADAEQPLLSTLREEPHLFGQLARLVWEPLLAHETLRQIGGQP